MFQFAPVTISIH